MLYLRIRIEQWNTKRSNRLSTDGFLHGRGAADMKGSLASMIVAVEQFIAKHPDHTGSIGFSLSRQMKKVLSSAVRYVLLKH